MRHLFVKMIYLFLLLTACIGTVQAQTISPQNLSIITKLYPDNSSQIQVEYSDISFLPANLSVYILPTSCPNNWSQLRSVLNSDDVCLQESASFAITQKGTYDFQPPRSSWLLIVSCQDSNNDCGAQPDNYVLIQSFSLLWYQDVTTNEEQLSIQQISMDVPKSVL